MPGSTSTSWISSPQDRTGRAAQHPHRGSKRVPNLRPHPRNLFNGEFETRPYLSPLVCAEGRNSSMVLPISRSEIPRGCRDSSLPGARGFEVSWAHRNAPLHSHLSGRAEGQQMNTHEPLSLIPAEAGIQGRRRGREFGEAVRRMSVPPTGACRGAKPLCVSFSSPNPPEADASGGVGDQGG